MAIKPILSNNWWPQLSPGEITPSYNGKFYASGYLGGNNSDLFEIGILILNNETNEKFLEWSSYSNNATNWVPITDKSYPSNVTDAEIDAQRLVSLEVELQKKSSVIWKTPFAAINLTGSEKK
jgi:hypothetical protein